LHRTETNFIQVEAMLAQT